VTEPHTADSAQDAPPAETAPPQRKRTGWRVLGRILAVLGAILVIAVVGFVTWSQIGVMAAEPEPVAAVQANPAIDVTDDGTAIVLSPTSGATGEGLVYYPGAKVDAWAYAAKLSGLVEEGTTLVIVRPWLNLALFDLRPLSTFTELAPGVDTWAVGGHSMGGVRACIVSADADRLVLFAAYCGSDISGTGIPVLSVSGSEDALATPQKIADSRHLLPTDAEFAEIAGASHSSFGDYGPQPGDGTPTISDDDMTAQLTELVSPFLTP